ncbi:MAG: hypothetical protein KatS3mg028_0813 [Bacteroidia bacterium]|nr:MAG: hypothetical protein KatS3mg028_0813 [Bacteroidia bacterium]
MKKLLLTAAVAVGMTATINAKSKFQLNENELQTLITQSTEMTVGDIEKDFSNAVHYKATVAPEKTKGGYLLRAFFCGGIALHRYYMGTNQKWMWAMYFCIPVVGGINACVDFWGVLFNAIDYKKYANNDKYIVWMD